MNKPQKTNVRRGSAASAAVADLDLREGQSVELLKELHILTREGKLNQDSRRKLKQVYHLYQFIEKLMQDMASSANAQFTLADHGAGKSYLGFIVYDLWLKHHPNTQLFGIETRGDLVDKSRTLALRLGFDRMHFLNASVAESTSAKELPPRVDVVTALHACDTATDDAIAFGLEKNARAMVLVPCCQAELARHLQHHNKAFKGMHVPFAELWKRPLHAREMGSHITNVLRCLYLEARGYAVTVTELVGWEHSLKNELIIAKYTGHHSQPANVHLRQILAELGLNALLDTRFTLPVDNAHP
ncbi:MAG: SAM-dependent methyltransferase [Rhodoferax sp.]|nr:SAM-dependent methyltransferase [Rhodoferax sp.]